MQNVPKPGSPFFAAYQVALDWCDDVPDGNPDHDDCIIGSLGTISMRAQVAADRTTLLETAFVVIVFCSLAVLLSRRLARRRMH